MRPVDFFLRSAMRLPDAPALIDGSAVMTYGALAAETQALAAGLQAIDPAPASRVVIAAGNCTAHVVAWLATLMAEKVWVPVHPRNGAAEAARIVETVRPSIMIGDEEGLAVLPRGPGTILAAGAGQVGTAALAARHAGQRPVEYFLGRDATAAIKFTGGTTGKPKGVMQPNRAWLANIVTQLHTWRFAAGERTLAAAPITHGTSTYLLPTWAAGGTLVLADRLKPPALLALMERKAIARVFLPPTVIDAMAEDGSSSPARFPALRQIIYGAAPMLPPAIARAHRAFGPRIGGSYGQTEAPQIIAAIDETSLADAGLQACAGRETLLTRIGILGPDGAELPTGETGEICARGDLVMTGYWEMEEATATTLAGGWLHTGDLGSVDERGWLTLRGRSKEMIITGGFNVYPAEVEPVLAAHPSVADAAVYGRADAKWGEVVCAAVVARPGAVIEVDALRAHVRAALGPVRVPKHIAILAELPRNNYGKLQKQLLPNPENDA